MKLRPILTFAAVLLVAVAAWAAFQVEATTPPASAASLLPPGAMITIESPDFGALLSSWNHSAEKRAWIASDNHSIFSNSRLFGRLSAAQNQFAQDAGLPAGMPMLTQLAGQHSIFGWYNIGKLQFLYLSRVPASRVTQSALWQARATFHQRSAAGIPFYLRSNAQTGRTVCFAFTHGWLVLATREDLIAQSLALIAGEHQPSVADSAWYADAVHAASKPGDLRMVLNLAKIIPSPYFRSYWIQQDITAMKQYRAAISDLYRSEATYREDRVLLPVKPPTPVPPNASVASLTALVPARAGFYLATAAPTAKHVLAVLRDKLLAPQPAASQNNTYAPAVSTATTNAGSTSDLQTRIDQAPVSSSGPEGWKPLQTLLAHSRFHSMLQVESSATQANGVFTTFPAAVILSTSQPSDPSAWKSSLTAALALQLTAGRLGLAWQNNNGVWSLNGLLPLYLAVHNHLLIVSNNLPLLTAVLHRAAHFHTTPSNIAYAAGFRHAREAAPFAHLTAILDQSNRNTFYVGGSSQAPPFFSGNIASLSKVFQAVQSETIQTRIQPDEVTQSIVYSWKKP